MIKSFQNKELAIFWLSNGKTNVKHVPSELRQVTYRKLRELNRAKDERDLRAVPSNHFERLHSAKYIGYQSIRINKQYCLLFLWKNNQAYEVEINKHDKKY